MREETIAIPTRDGAMRTLVIQPDRGAHPPVLLLMDALGMRAELRAMAWRLATVGYCVLLPDLYYRAGHDTAFTPAMLEPGSEANIRLRTIRAALDVARVMEDVAAMIAFCAAWPGARTGAVGVHGYCMSGSWAIAAAANFPDRIAAAASFFGARIEADILERPRVEMAAIRGEIHIALAGIDEHDPLATAAALRRLLSAAGTRGEVEVHARAHHGFAFPDRKTYDHDAAERHWERLVALYRRTIG